MRWSLLWLLLLISGLMAAVIVAVTPSMEELDAFDRALEASTFEDDDDEDEDADAYA